MSKVFIYYSLSGNGDAVAAEMRKQGFDIVKVETEKKPPKTFFFQILVGGFQAGTRKKAKLKNYNGNVSGYDTVAVGSPVWNGRLTPAINTVLSKTDLTGKNLIFVLYSGSGEGQKAKKDLISAYPNAEIVVLKNPKNNDEEMGKLAF